MLQGSDGIWMNSNIFGSLRTKLILAPLGMLNEFDLNELIYNVLRLNLHATTKHALQTYQTKQLTCHQNLCWVKRITLLSYNLLAIDANFYIIILYIYNE